LPPRRSQPLPRAEGGPVLPYGGAGRNLAAARVAPATTATAEIAQQEDPMAEESYTGEAYCVKCKAKREFTGHVEETNGRRFAKGICPTCGTKVTRILGKA